MGDVSEQPSVEQPEPDAVARARATRVAVVGGGIAGLVAALEWAKIGARVTILEASDRLGGAVETADLDGLPVDVVADAVPLRASAIRALLEELGLTGALEPAAPHPVWIAGVSGTGAVTDAAPLPTASVLGIPANPWADDVRRIIGWRGAWRAYLDRLRPPLTIGHERSLGRLVRSRMGDRVADRLVAPVTRGLYGVEPDDIDVEVAAPGLSTALTRTGSLAGAVAALLPDSSAADAAPTRATLRGGLGTLVDALVDRLHELGAVLQTDAEVCAITGGAAWTVTPARAEPGAGNPLDPGRWEADVVVVATGGARAAALLGTAGIEVTASSAQPRDVVALVVDAPGLDDAPRGRAVYPVTAAAAGSTSAVAVAHATADWPWLAAAAGAGRHVLRVTLVADDGVSDAAVVADAVRAAESVLGVQVGSPRASARRAIALEPPASALGHAEHRATVRAAAARHPGLALVGSWLSGSGLAQVVADAVAESDRVRSALLWGRTASPEGDG